MAFPLPARFLLAALLLPVLTAAAPDRAARNVVLVTLDGLRWQEVFRGADEALLDVASGGVPEKEIPALRSAMLAPTAEERRAKLMPFVWGEIARRGQLIGNRDRGSVMRVANAEHFSYPGYNELLCGFPDPLIVSNAPIPNRNVTVLEWLHGRPGFGGRVAAAVTWQVLPATINVGRSRLPVWVSSGNPALAATSPRLADIERWLRDIPTKARDEHYDGFGFRAAMTLLEERSPRVFWMALGEPDTDAHARRYDRYLAAITRCDRFLGELWASLQARDGTRDNTTLIVTTDHGRGRDGTDWKNHNKTTPGSDETWLAIIGPDTPPLGERGADHAPVLSTQIAATVAAAVGENFPAAEPRAAAAFPGALR